MMRRPRYAAVAPWRRWLPVIGGLALLLLAPLIAHAQTPPDSVRLAWTAPGDDGTIGTATTYDLRVSTSPINAGNWSSATPVAGMPAPLVSGSRQEVTVRGLVNGTRYFFAIRTADDAGNWSNVSNLVQWDWVYDTAPPAIPAGIAAAAENANARVTWSANSDPDLVGYHVYRALAASGPWSRLTGSPIATTQYLDTAVPQGVPQVWYAISAVDNSANESGRSASASVAFGGAIAADRWNLQPGYPNPSGSADVVRIPIVVPTAGPGGAVIDILDAGGHRVRRLELAGIGAGTATVDWDGRNDAGRATAPGVYRAWLIAGDTRQVIRLVRVP